MSNRGATFRIEPGKINGILFYSIDSEKRSGKEAWKTCSTSVVWLFVTGDDGRQRTGIAGDRDCF